MFSIEEYHKAIGDKLKDLDIGMVVLNAGMATSGLLNDKDDNHIEQVMQINTNHVIYSAKVLIPQLVKRFEEKKIKAAILMTSSYASNQPLPGVATYSASKIFVNYMAEALFTEHKNEIDVLAYCPLYVVTKMVEKWKTKIDQETITADHAAEVCFRDLGISPTSTGAFKHEKMKF